MSDSLPILHAIYIAKAYSISSSDPTVHSDATIEEETKVELKEVYCIIRRDDAALKFKSKSEWPIRFPPRLTLSFFNISIIKKTFKPKR